MKKRTVMLLRHAKSDWDAPYTSDFDRPLNERGRGSAPLIGAYANENGHIPDLILCSPALRTQQTCALFTQELDQKIEVVYAEAIYGAHTNDLAHLIKSCDDDDHNILIIGHNPGLGAMAYNLAPDETEKFGKFPTASFAVFHYSGDKWQEFDMGKCTLLDFVKPRDLT